jgi:hypothetical protein
MPFRVSVVDPNGVHADFGPMFEYAEQASQYALQQFADWFVRPTWDGPWVDRLGEERHGRTDIRGAWGWMTRESALAMLIDAKNDSDSVWVTLLIQNLETPGGSWESLMQYMRMGDPGYYLVLHKVSAAAAAAASDKLEYVDLKPAPETSRLQDAADTLATRGIVVLPGPVPSLAQLEKDREAFDATLLVAPEYADGHAKDALEVADSFSGLDTTAELLPPMVSLLPSGTVTIPSPMFSDFVNAQRQAATDRVRDILVELARGRGGVTSIDVELGRMAVPIRPYAVSPDTPDNSPDTIVGIIPRGTRMYAVSYKRPDGSRGTVVVPPGGIILHRSTLELYEPLMTPAYRHASHVGTRLFRFAWTMRTDRLRPTQTPPYDKLSGYGEMKPYPLDMVRPTGPDKIVDVSARRFAIIVASRSMYNLANLNDDNSLTLALNVGVEVVKNALVQNKSTSRLTEAHRLLLISHLSKRRARFASYYVNVEHTVNRNPQRQRDAVIRQMPLIPPIMVVN